MMFSDTCPVCKGPMATGNKFCRIACWEGAEGQIRLEED